MRSIISLFFCLSTLVLGAQSGIHRLTDARSQALAGSTVMNQGLFALYGNPAGLAQVTQVQGIALLESPFALSELQRAGFGLAVPLENSAFGFKAASYGFDAYREGQFSLAYSRMLNANLSLGGEIIYWHQHIPAYRSAGFLTFALGFQARLSPTLQAGAQLFNPIRARVTEDETTFSSLQIGLLYQPSEQLDILAEVYKDLDFPAEIKAGIDYWIDPRLALRLGIGTAPVRISFGLGIQVFPGWAIDMAASRQEFLGFSPGFSLRYIGTSEP